MSTSSAAQPEMPNHQAQARSDADQYTPTDADLIAAVLHHLQTQTGHDFSHYKASSLLRRIGRRMAVNEINELAAYLAYLRRDPAEAQALLRECLIGVTEFFRNPETFAALAGALIPPILRAKPAGEPVRIWVVGCATGEEAYSIAMLLSEAVATLPSPPPIQVFATDINEENLALARRGFYAPAITEQVSSERLQRFFIEEKEGYRVKVELREKVLFAVHNLLSDPPFSNLDLICCRNVLIYFERDAQEKSFELFHYALRPDGYLFLGTSESADSAVTFFTAVDKRHHFYQRRPTNSGRARRLPALAGGIKTLPATAQPLTVTPRTVQEIYQAWTLRRYAPPRLLVNEAYDVVHLFNGAGRYLIEPDGPPTQNILQKVIPALRLDLRAALYQAFQKGERTESRLLQTEIEGKTCFIQVHVGPVTEADFPKELIEVVFEESKEEIVIGAANAELMTTVAESELVARLEEELQRTRERMQTILEEHESSIQELRTTNEELQSINEELKSTGEELETSKEELQSMNEELVTVNSELKLKIEELSRANSDLFNLMASTNVGVIFLDGLLQVKRFTPRATELFHLIEGDVGRPFAHIAHRIHSGATTGDGAPLRVRPLEMAQQVHATLEQVEEVVHGDNGRWYILRLFPYRTLDHSVDGVVITFIDITDWQRAEHELQQRLQQQTVADLGRQALQGDDPTTLLQSATTQISERLGVEFGAIFALQPDGNLLLQAGVGWAVAEMDTIIVNADQNFPIWYALRATQPVVMENMPTSPHYTQSPLLLTHNIVSGVSLTIGLGERPYGVLGVYSTRPRPFSQYDIDFLQAIANLLTEAIRRHEMAAALAHSETHLRNTVELNPQVPWTATLAGDIDSFSQRWLDLTGLTQTAALGDGWLQVSHPDDRQTMRAAWRHSLQTGSPYDMEHRIRLADGAYRWMRSRAVPHRNAQGALTRWYGATEDIHERKLAEEALRESEARLRLGMTVAGVAIAEVDYNSHTITLSTEAAALYGLPAKPVRVPRATLHDCFHPADRPWLLPQIEQVLDPQGSGVMAVEHRIVLPDESVRWLQVRKQVFFTPPGDKALRPLRSLLAAVDITARKQAEEELETYATALARINDELLRGYQELDQYADIMAHDLREPLRGIRNYATYLLEDYSNLFDAEGLEMIQTLGDLSQRVDHRLNAMLNYAQLGRQVLTRHRVALPTLLEEMLTLLHPRLNAAQAVVRVMPGVPVVQGDPLLLADLFTNLIINAMQYNDKAEKWVEIGWMAGQDDKVTSDKGTSDKGTSDKGTSDKGTSDKGTVDKPVTLSPPHPVIFYVRDNGIGIAPEHHEAIFQLFRRLHGRDDYGGGVGAGLALAKRIIERHGGRIWLTSQPGAGTTFYFTLGEEQFELDQRKSV